MFVNDFYTYRLIRQTDDVIEATITINPKHRIFDGHFPEYPLVPGVVQIQIIKEVASQCLNGQLQLVQSKSIKFLAMISPLQVQELQLRIAYRFLDENHYKIEAQLYNDTRSFLKLKGTYRATH